MTMLWDDKAARSIELGRNIGFADLGVICVLWD